MENNSSKEFEPDVLTEKPQPATNQQQLSAAKNPDPPPLTENSPVMQQSDFEDLPRKDSWLNKLSHKIWAALKSRWTKYIIAGFALLAFAVCVAANIYQLAAGNVRGAENVENSIRLLWVTALVLLVVAIHFARKKFGDSIEEFTQKIHSFACKFSQQLRIGFGILAAVIVAGCVIWAGVERPQNLISGCGLVLLLLLTFLCSRDHGMIQWQPVIGGITIQFLFALLILKTPVGYAVFDFLGKRVSEFLSHCNHGNEFVFGQNYRDHFFLFSVLPVVIYFAAVIAVLFHYGLLVMVIEKVGFVMQFVMGTTASESFVAAANIFVGFAEAPLLIGPFMKRMTNSELHSVMTSGFATIAGGVMAAYIEMGVPARHLMGASVMSAPAALAVSKLLMPETKKSLSRAADIKKVSVQRYSNFLEAAGSGAVDALKIVASIAVNLIAFVSLLAFLNSTLTWLGRRAGLEFDLTFELIASYALLPLAFTMGVPTVDCRAVAELIGSKTFVNEFFAYQRLSTMLKNYKTFLEITGNSTGVTYSRRGIDVVLDSYNQTLVGGVIFQEKSVVISTYSLCGFSNFGSIGMLIGALSAMVPQRRADIVSCSVTAMFGGNVACFLTACIAGLFYSGK